MSTLPAVRIDAHALIAQAIERNTDPTALERIVALAERMQDTQAKQAWVSSMTQAQQEFPPIEKGKEARTGSYSYKYAPLDEIDPLIKPVLHKHELVMTWQYDCSRPGEVGANCRITHALGHHEDSGFFFVPIEPAAPGGKGATAPQRAGIAATYARRYSCTAITGIVPVGEDPDGKAPAGEEEPTAVKRDDGSVLIVRVEEVHGGKPGQRGWTRYDITMDDGQVVATFTASLAQAAKTAQADKTLVIPVTENTPKGVNLLSLTPAALVVPGGPVEAAQKGFDDDVRDGAPGGPTPDSDGELEAERDALNAEVVRLGNLLKLRGPARAELWTTFCGQASPDKVAVVYLADLVAEMKKRAGELA